MGSTRLQLVSHVTVFRSGSQKLAKALILPKCTIIQASDRLIVHWSILFQRDVPHVHLTCLDGYVSVERCCPKMSRLILIDIVTSHLKFETFLLSKYFVVKRFSESCLQRPNRRMGAAAQNHTRKSMQKRGHTYDSL
jgi:hypothetical protein